MNGTKATSFTAIKAVLLTVIFLSSLALIYHIRWFIPFLQNKTNVVIPNEKVSVLWYVVQICNNIIFLLVSFLLIKVFKKYKQTGFFNEGSRRVLNAIILSCVTLALLGSALTVYDNFYEIHYNQWTSIESVANLIFRSFTQLLVFKEPQTMYFLLAIILWVVKQFVNRALFIKEENEAFI